MKTSASATGVSPWGSTREIPITDKTFEVNALIENQFNKLRIYYHSLVDIQRGLENKNYTSPVILQEDRFYLIAYELDEIEAAFPNLIPPFSPDLFKYDKGGYSTPALITYLGMAISRLKVALDNQESTPVTETRDFSYVQDFGLRKVLERDYTEIQRAYIAQCWKSVIILSGSAIEAILLATLLDCMKSDPKRAASASKVPSKPDLSKWDLSDLIDVCIELDLVSQGVEKLSHSVRQYRNLVHPGNEIRDKLVFGQEEARIAIEVLHLVHRDLNP
jgi:hypothetical protein